MQVPIDERNAAAGTIVWRDPETGERFETPVTGGHCKLQWKPDWAMRWVALGVDYEMAGKDLIDSVKLSGEICPALGGTPPEGFNYELFLDEKGQKISKSKGNGLTIDEWLRLRHAREPVALHVPASRARPSGSISTSSRAQVDDYLHVPREAIPAQDAKAQLGNPVWHIHAGQPPPSVEAVPGDAFVRMLLNLVAASPTPRTKAVLWGFIRRYAPGVSPETHPRLDQLVGYAVAYFRDFVKPHKSLPAGRRRSSARRCARSSGVSATLPPEAGGRGDPGAGLRGRPRRSRATRISTPRARRPERPGVSQRVVQHASTRCCSARSAGRASAPSPRSTASPRRAR